MAAPSPEGHSSGGVIEMVQFSKELSVPLQSTLLAIVGRSPAKDPAGKTIAPINQIYYSQNQNTRKVI